MKIDVSSRATMQWLPKYNLTNRDQWIELNDLAFANAGLPPANHFNGNTDWQKEVFKTGVVQDHNISFQEVIATATITFLAITSTTQEQLSVRKVSVFIFRSNSSTSRDFGDAVTFRMGENVALSNYAVDELNTNPIVDVYRMLPTISIYDPNNESKGGYGFGDGSRDVTFGTNPLPKKILKIQEIAIYV